MVSSPLLQLRPPVNGDGVDAPRWNGSRRSRRCRQATFVVVALLAATVCATAAIAAALCSLLLLPPAPPVRQGAEAAPQVPTSSLAGFLCSSASATRPGSGWAAWACGGRSADPRGQRASAGPSGGWTPMPPLRDQADIQALWVKDRLDRILPALMAQHGVQLWLVSQREYGEDPVFWATVPRVTTLSARRRTIQVFYLADDGAFKRWTLVDNTPAIWEDLKSILK
ncbi:hypothetical protein HK405_005616, partial [Cladochytrium tenue]